jgi:hypothetical protein
MTPVEERSVSRTEELSIQAAQLDRREHDWFGIITAEAVQRGETSERRLLAIFDVFDDWLQRDDYEACSFITVLLERGKGHSLGQASVGHLTRIRTVVATFAQEAELHDPAGFALSWHLLMKGAIVCAVEGDGGAALRAKEMARALIGVHRQGALATGGRVTDAGAVTSAVAVASVVSPASDWTDWSDEYDL